VIRVLGVSGSLRAQSSTTALLRTAREVAPAGMVLEIYDSLAELPAFNPDLDGEGALAPPPVACWRKLVHAADALAIASPEYAHGVPGALKNAIDWLVSTDAVSEKPIALFVLSPSGGHFARAQLAETLCTMYARVVPSPELQLARARADATGCVTDEPTRASLRACLEVLARAADDR
jgi:chromate reductase